MKASFKFLAMCIFALMLNSCKKEKKVELEPEPTPTGTLNTTNLQALIKNLSTPLQTFAINAGTYNTLTLANGTRIVIAPNAFLTSSGSLVTGMVNIEAKDILSKKDMALNNAFPVSNGQLLTSGGEVYFMATQSGQKLKINPSSSVRYIVPAGPSPSYSMLEFYSPGTADLSSTNLNWTTAPITQSVIPIFDSTGMAWAYDFRNDSMGWANCDYFTIYPGAKTSCTVNLAGSFDKTNTYVFIAMNGANMMALFGFSAYNPKTFISHTNSIPTGSNYTIVAIGFDGTNYYYGSQAITMTADMVINLPALTLSSKAGIETSLSLLP